MGGRGVQTLSVERSVLWYKMIFTAAKEFSLSVRNRTLLSIRQLPYTRTIDCLHSVVIDFC